MMNIGFDRLIRANSSSTLLNLMYHGVVENDCCYFSPRHITDEQFEKHLIYLKKNFDIISLPEAFRRQHNNIRITKRTITISFDDGFQNNLTIALPLLEKYEIPATFFVSAICAQEMAYRCIWPELIATLNYFHPNEYIHIPTNLSQKEHFTLNSNTIAYYLKSCDIPERNIILQHLIDNYDLEHKISTITEEIWRLLTYDEVAILSQSPFSHIGSHGISHLNLGAISLKTARHELLSSKLILEECIGKTIDMIAYPDGSYNDEVKHIAEDVGYKFQVAVDYRSSSDFEDNRIMNRHGISPTTTFESNMLNLNLAFHSKSINTQAFHQRTITSQYCI